MGSGAMPFTLNVPCQILDHEIISERWQSLLCNPTYRIVAKAARHTGMKCWSKVNKHMRVHCLSLKYFTDSDYEELDKSFTKTHTRVWALLLWPIHMTLPDSPSSPPRGCKKLCFFVCLFKCSTLFFSKIPHLTCGGWRPAAFQKG